MSLPSPSAIGVKLRLASRGQADFPATDLAAAGAPVSPAALFAAALCSR